MTKTTSINTGVKIGRSHVYTLPTGIRIGKQGRITRDVTSVLQEVDKGSARRIRKALRAQGLTEMAAAKRF